MIMKVTIELDLPDGQAIPKVEDIMRLTDPNWISDWWHISDVHDKANEWEEDDDNVLTDEEAREVLRVTKKYHDSEEGINWEVLEANIDHVKHHRKELA
jgi:hypothetical protein